MKCEPAMPRNIRELKADPLRASFRVQRGKGSRAVWKHRFLVERVTLSGADGDDAKPYQERDVQVALAAAREADRQRDERR